VRVREVGVEGERVLVVGERGVDGVDVLEGEREVEVHDRVVGALRESLLVEPHRLPRVARLVEDRRGSRRRRPASGRGRGRGGRRRARLPGRRPRARGRSRTQPVPRGRVGSEPGGGSAAALRARGGRAARESSTAKSITICPVAGCQAAPPSRTADLASVREDAEPRERPALGQLGGQGGERAPDPGGRHVALDQLLGARSTTRSWNENA